MGKHSDDDSPYLILDEEDAHELNIKPPQPKVSKRSHSRRLDKHSRSGGRQVYVSSSRHHHKSHHSRHHQDDRYPKERSDPSRSSHLKDYEERAKKKAYHHSRSGERHKEKDLREKLDRRKSHHHKEYDHRKVEDRNEKNRENRHSRHETKEHRNKDERRRHHHEDRKHSRMLEEKQKQNISNESQSPVEKDMVIDIEMSPPVFRGDDDTDHEQEEEQKEEVMSEPQEEEESEEAENSNNLSNTSSSSGDSNNSESSEEESGSEGSTSSGEIEMIQESDKTETKYPPEQPMEEGATPEKTPNEMDNSNENDAIESEIELEKDTLPPYFPAIQGCRSVEEFQCLNRIEEGTYGVVYRAREKRTERIVALKKLKMEKEKDGFPITSLREINTLLKAQHPNIVTVKEIVVGSNMDKIYIVMDYVEHDLKSLMETMKRKKTSFTPSEIKCLMLQLLRAVNHLHNNWILHRDLKTSNLLFSHAGVLKVGDFGLAREYGSPLKSYTPVVVTLWYRAPELLLGTKEYSTSIDVWSVGCIFAELLCMEPLFPGKAEIDQLKRIFKALGTPNEKIWPDYPKFPVVQKVPFPEFPPHGLRPKFVPSILTEVGYDLLINLLSYNTKKRITAEAALLHDYFSEHPMAIDPALFSTWPAKSEPGYRKAIASSPKPPSGGQNYKELREDDGFYIGVGERGHNPPGFNLRF